MSRRTFLAQIAGLGAGACAPASLLASQPAVRLHEILARRGIQSRALWLERPQSGEQVKLIYANGNTLLRQGYLDACRILRDVRADIVKPIDPGLLEVLSAAQAWLRLNGHDKPITVLSGYRSEKTNSSIEGAARNSLHTQGRAADIRIDGVKVELLSRMARLLADGGIGIYRDRNFIHVDTGALRSWSGR